MILLDPHNLFLRQKLPKNYIATFAICHCHLPFLASLEMANFDVQTSYGGLKVSEFNQEFISEVQNYQFKKNRSQINHLQFCIFFLCISPSNPMSMRRDAGIQVLGLSFDFLGSVYPQYIHINCHW